MIDKIRGFFPKGSIRGEALQIYTLQFLTLAVGLIGSIIIARTLIPAQKGLIDLFALLSSLIIDFGMLGFGSALLYFLANKRVPLSEIHGTGLVFALAMGFFTATIGWLGISFWRMIFPGMHEWIILLAFSLSPVAYYKLIYSNIMTGINKATTIYRIGFYFAIFNLLLIFSLWKLELLDVRHFLVFSASLSAVNGLVSFLILRKNEVKLRPNFDLAWKSLRYGFIIYVGFIANVLHFKIDQVMINYWLGTAAVGIYAVSVRWAEALFVLDSAIISAALYKISSSTVEESYALTNRLFKVQLLISGMFGILLAILAYPLIFVLYGKAYSGAIWPLILLIPGVVAWSVSKIVSGMLVYNRGLASYLTKVGVLGAVTNIFLNYLFLSMMRTGIVGASVASSLSYLMVATIIVFKAIDIK